MKVYIRSPKARLQKDFVMNIAPASDVKNMEIPPDWFDDQGKPRQFNVMFEYGAAEVEDEIGRYLIAKGYAAKSALVLPGDIHQENYLDILNNVQGG